MELRGVSTAERNSPRYVIRFPLPLVAANGTFPFCRLAASATGGASAADHRHIAPENPAPLACIFGGRLRLPSRNEIKEAPEWVPLLFGDLETFGNLILGNLIWLL